MAEEKILSYRLEVTGTAKEAETLAKIEQSLKNVNEQRKQLNKSVKDGKVSADQAAQTDQKYIKTQTELRISKQKLTKELKDGIKAYNTNANSIEGMRARMNKLRTAMQQLDLSTEQGTKELKRMSTQYNQLNTKVRNFDRSISGSSTLVGEYSKGFVTGFKSMALSVVGATAVLYAFSRAVKAGVGIIVDFDQALADVNSILRPTTAELERLKQSAIDLGSSTRFTASEVLGLQKELGKLGFTVNEIMAGQAGILDFAAATGAALPEAAKTAGVAIRAFGLDAEDMQQTVATLAVATTKSALAFEDYDTVLSTAGPVARAYNFSLADTLALTGKLRDAGFDASKASTALRNIFLNLADTNGDLAKALGGNATTIEGMVEGLIKLREKGISLNETLELTDKRSVAAFNQFLETAEGALVLRDSISDVTGELKEMVGIQLDTVTGRLDLLKSAVQGLTMSIDEETGFSEFLKKFIDAATDGVTELSKIVGGDMEEAVNKAKNAMYNFLVSVEDTEADEKLAAVSQEIVNQQKLLDERQEVYNGYSESLDSLRGKEKRNTKQFLEEEKVRIQTLVQYIQYLDAERKKLAGPDAEETTTTTTTTTTTGGGTVDNELAKAREKMEKLLELNHAYNEYFYELSEEDLENIYEFNGFEIDAEVEKQETIKSIKDQVAKEDEKQKQKDLAREKQHQKNKTEIINAGFDTMMMVADFYYARNQAMMNQELAKAGDNEEKKEEIKREYAKKQQRVDIALAIIGAGRAVINALQTQPFMPMGPIMAGVAAAQGAIQIATIKQQKFATGGVVRPGYELPGSRKGQDNTLALVKPGEVVLNQHQQMRVGGPDVFKRAGVPGFDAGGIIGGIPQPVQGVETSSDMVMRSLMGVMTNIRVSLNLNELAREQDNLAFVNETSEL